MKLLKTLNTKTGIDFEVYIDDEQNVFVTSYLNTKKDIQFQSERGLYPLFQAKIIGDRYGWAYATGDTMINSFTTKDIKYLSLDETINNDNIVLTIKGKDSRNNIYTSVITYFAKYDTFTCVNEFTCNDEIEQTLEMFNSFTMCGLNKYGTSMEDFNLTKYRAKWSMEGRPDTQRFVDMQLDGDGYKCEKFGQVGSMPVKNFFPHVAIEDTVNNLAWAAKLETACTWNIEVHGWYDNVGLSLGGADRYFGEWKKTIKPGEKFVAPKAIFTMVHGDKEMANRNLLKFQEIDYSKLSLGTEENLPVMFNEYCQTWGNPSEENLLPLVDVADKLGCEYFVIDAGWYETTGDRWDNALGEWNVSRSKFPNGIKTVTDYIKSKNMKPGIWFEYEVCGINTKRYFEEKELFLKKDGIDLQVNDRKFMNMTLEKSIEYLDKKVVDLINDNGIGYLKVDYNETIGTGVDNIDSHGEGLRQQMAASVDYFSKLTTKIPGLVLENCASGGHRLNPSYMKHSHMSSFSDAHENIFIPIVGADLLELILLKQSQIWCVVKEKYEDDKNRYIMANGFLGRMCISGDIDKLSGEQFELVKEYVDLYKKVTPIFKDCFAKTTRSHKVGSNNNLRGHQHVIIDNEELSEQVHIIQSFRVNEPVLIDLDGYEISEYIGSSDVKVINNNVYINSDYGSVIIHTKGKNEKNTRV